MQIQEEAAEKKDKKKKEQSTEVAVQEEEQWLGPFIEEVAEDQKSLSSPSTSKTDEERLDEIIEKRV